MAVSSDIKTQQNKTSAGAQKKKKGLIGRIIKDGPKKAIMDSVMAKVMSSMGIPTPEEMQADMKKDMPAMGPEAEAVEKEDVNKEPTTSDESSNALKKSEAMGMKEEDNTLDEPSGDATLTEAGKNFQTEPSTDKVDTATALPTTEGLPKREIPVETAPSENAPTLNEPASAIPAEEKPSPEEPTNSDAQPDAMVTPTQGKPNLAKPEQKEPKKPNPTLKEKPSKNDPKLKPEMELPTEDDLKS